MPHESNDTTPAVPMTSGLHPELQRFCEDMRDDMKEVKTALTGNKYQPGLIPRVDKIEATVAAHDKKMIVWSAGLTALGAIIVYFKDFFKPHA